MKISKKAEYALRAVVAMARTPRTGPVPIQELSKTARVPVKFLEQIPLILKRGGLLKSQRGVGRTDFHMVGVDMRIGQNKLIVVGPSDSNWPGLESVAFQQLA